VKPPIDRDELNECRRCDLWRRATQGVPGQGLRPATIMLIGEQPGNEEDLAGAPFVGPAGRILDRALEQAGVDRDTVYVTNAVKHFKWEPRGKRRLHKKPNAGQIAACRYWLERELKTVQPVVIVALGTTALYSLTGKAMTLTATRGKTLPHPSGAALMATLHPSAVLRAPDDDRRKMLQRLVKDLRRAARVASKDATSPEKA
jgi:uracil-DNA glycosylase family protein